MKKIVLSVIFVTLCVWGYCDYSKSVRRAELAAQTRETLDRLNEIDDNLHGYFKGDTTYFAYNNGEAKIYLSNKKYVVKENIGDNRMIIYDGKGMCYIGTICLERNKYPSFRTEISFRSKPLVREGYVLDDDDIHEFIRELKRAKAAYVKYHNITVQNQVVSHYETYITGNPPKFGLGSEYGCDSGVDYVAVRTVGGVIKFNSTDEIDSMIHTLNKFKTKKLINVDELYS